MFTIWDCMSKVIFFEYPFNEKMRVYLRLEHLFDKLFFFSIKEADAMLHDVALTTLFDILDLIERSDIKNYLLQDLEKQKIMFSSLRNNINVNQLILEDAVNNLERILMSLIKSGKPGQMLRENEWLNSIRGRLSVPGCAAKIDMPSYYSWQNKNSQDRFMDLTKWINCLIPIYDSLILNMRLLRESNNHITLIAKNGNYRKMLGGKIYQLLRIGLFEHKYYPEISANKHIIWIRFFNQDDELKPCLVLQDVEFYISLCNII